MGWDFVIIHRDELILIMPHSWIYCMIAKIWSQMQDCIFWYCVYHVMMGFRIAQLWMFCWCLEIRMVRKAKFLITIVQDDQTNKARLVITPGKGSDHSRWVWQGVSDQVFDQKIWGHVADHHSGEVTDHVMEAKLVISDSTIMFCCIMFNAMFVVVRWAGGHIWEEIKMNLTRNMSSTTSLSSGEISKLVW